MKCGVRNCTALLTSERVNEHNPWCVAHDPATGKGVKCIYPPCSLNIIPNSGWCQEHNDLVQFLDFYHPLRHQEAVQQQAMAQRNAEIMRMIQGNGGDPGPGGIHIARR